MTNPIRRCADAGRAGISTSFFEINYFFNIHELTAGPSNYFSELV